MSNRSDSERSPRDKTFSATFALCAAAIGCAIVMMAVPRPAPFELPTLELDAKQAREQLVRDQQLAARPLSKEARTVYEYLLEAGRRELAGTLGADAAWLVRSQNIHRTVLLMAAPERQALYAFATQRFMAALVNRRSDDESRGLLGKQSEQLLEHGYMTEGGTLLAPELTVRATYKVRLDMLFAQPVASQLTAIERSAYEGFRALEATHVPDDVRQQALLEFRKLKGPHVDEALLIWAAKSGKPEPFIALLRESPEASKKLRLRNMAVTALQQLEARESSFEP